MDGGLDSLATILVTQEEGAPLGAQPTAASTMKRPEARSASSGHVNDGRASTQSARLAREIRIVGWMGWASGTGAFVIYRPANLAVTTPADEVKRGRRGGQGGGG